MRLIEFLQDNNVSDDTITDIMQKSHEKYLDPVKEVDNSQLTITYPDGTRQSGLSTKLTLSDKTYNKIVKEYIYVADKEEIINELDEKLPNARYCNKNYGILHPYLKEVHPSYVLYRFNLEL